MDDLPDLNLLGNGFRVSHDHELEYREAEADRIQSAETDYNTRRVGLAEPLLISTDVSTGGPSASDCCQCCMLEKNNTLHRQIKYIFDRQVQLAQQDISHQLLLQERSWRTKTEGLLEKYESSLEGSRRDLQKLYSLLDESNAVVAVERERRYHRACWPRRPIVYLFYTLPDDSISVT